MAAIAARAVVKRFGDVKALDGLDIAIPEGELYGLIGPNGSGKTTLIRILTGLDRATAGDATVLGERPGARAAEVGYMPQEEALYTDLSVLENLEFFGGLYDAPVAERAPVLLRLVRLWDDRDRPVSTLSGGMRRRVSLAVSLLHEPRALFLDEPTVGVDPLLRTELWGRFNALAREGAALLITTHHLEEAKRCDRVGLLWRGRIIREGAPAALLRETETDSLEGAFLVILRRLGLER
ncbi:MAG TPA: ABC transporter ATP-binding protein [Candidatus Thermoplasmatota archaeon]|nr:ABC transporter ATP-binding protein [Candidatus Thermoplasmatota archaeon]